MIKSAASRMMNLTHQIIYNSSFVDYSEEKDFGKIVLNRPKALNSLNLQMVKGVIDLLPQISKTKAFWIEGAGGKAFCAGGDVKVLFEGEATYQNREEFFRNQFTMDYSLSQIKSLQIANWDGIVMGGGVGISVFSPYRIATEKTMFAMPEGKIGFFTDVGSCYFLAKMRSNIGYYLALTSSRLKGEDVYNSGLANYFIPSQKISTVYNELKNDIPESTNPKSTIEAILNKYHAGKPNKKIANEDEIKEIFSGSSVKQIYENAKKKEGNFAQDVVKNLEQFCPLSIHVIDQLIRTVGDKSVRECFIRDFNIAKFFSRDHNFREGVTCLLIEKGKTPKWTHKHLMDVSEATVREVFTELDDQNILKI